VLWAAAARARGDGRQAACSVCGLRRKRWAGEKKKGRLGQKGEKGRERGFGISFFQTLSQTLQTSLKHKTMHLNYDAQALIVSNIIEMIFKYFKHQIYLII
jgi:hypothetical protein